LDDAKFADLADAGWANPPSPRLDASQRLATKVDLVLKILVLKIDRLRSTDRFLKNPKSGPNFPASLTAMAPFSDRFQAASD